MTSPVSIPPLLCVSIWSKMSFARSMPRESTSERVGAASERAGSAAPTFGLSDQAPCWRRVLLTLKVLCVSAQSTSSSLRHNDPSARCFASPAHGAWRGLGRAERGFSLAT